MSAQSQFKSDSETENKVRSDSDSDSGGGVNFRRSRWLFSRHLETVAAAFSKAPRVEYQREIVALPDSDEIALDYILGENNRPLIVLFHGLEGCSQSRTLRVFASGFARMGWSVAAPHFRSCGGHMNKFPRAYHAGDRRDIRQILKYCDGAFVHASPLFALGVSLGGNALVKHLARPEGEGAIVRAAAVVCAPHNLALSAKAMDDNPLRRNLYARHFLKSLRGKVALKRVKFPALCDPRELRRARRIADFDRIYTAPVHGFASEHDYWERSSCGDDFEKVQTPLLCINALNDPLVPAATLTSPERAPRVDFRRPRHGGHGGFIGSPPDWLFHQVRDFFAGRL